MFISNVEINTRLRKHLWRPLEVRGVYLTREQKADIRKRIISKIKTTENVRSPYGFAVHLMKTERAALLETKAENKVKATTKTNKFGEEVNPLASDPFEKLGGRYESETKVRRERDCSSSQPLSN